MSFVRNAATKNTIILIALFLLNACSQPLVRPNSSANDLQSSAQKNTQNKNGNELFKRTLKAHGGDYLSQMQDVNLSILGKWGAIPARIMPKVADQYFRVSSEEHFMPNQGLYAAFYNGPAGTKKVVRSTDSVEVYYNNEISKDTETLQATAMTSDAFVLFSLGPLALNRYQTDFTQIADGDFKGKKYHRIYTRIKPGLGFAKEDEVVLWINPETNLTYILEVTLKGYPQTKNAHVNVRYLEYQEFSKSNQYNFTLPTHIIERVLAPINVHAHTWRVTGLDLNRGISLNDIKGKKWQGRAIKSPMPVQSKIGK